MEFLNVGTGELLFLVLLAILVIGPRRTVELTRQVGRLLGRLQQEWRSVQRELMTEMRSLEEEATGRAARPSPSKSSEPVAAASDEEEAE
ncbi:MAG: twin-arginine translocase TatA/TatE family subunit [Anaerolineae bacterium]|jgi:sec-independent protein translocase protein TatB